MFQMSSRSHTCGIIIITMMVMMMMIMIIILIMITNRFPAHDELGKCGTSLVSPQQSVAWNVVWNNNTAS